MNTTTIADSVNRPSDLFVTAATLQRRKLTPNLHAEAFAFRQPAKALADDPAEALRHLLEIARLLCNAGTAGLSLLRHDQAGDAIVRWEAISGALARHEGTDTPRDSSPCGLCLDAGVTIVVSRPERAFSRLHDARPTIAEDLIVPLYDSMNNPLGTLWVAHHDRTSHFSADDARMVEQLAVQLVLTLRLMEQARERPHALALQESHRHQVAQRNLLAGDLSQERRRHERIESASREALVFKDAMLQEVNHRTKNTLQAAASLLYLHERATSSAQVREALHDSRQRLQVLAHAHELLYSNPDNTQTILMPSLLQSLGDALRQSFGNASALVRLEFACDAIVLPPETAIPMALFANEVVTNAYKHAFPKDRTGTITVHLRCMPENTLVLRIADTGIGLHASGDESGMGLKLIRILATQLHGELNFADQADTGGTVVTLAIEAPGAAKVVVSDS